MLVLQAQKINKFYGDRQVLNSVSLTLHKGERVGLVGVNGCGKSTLLGCISGDIAMDSGEISVAAQCRLARLDQIPEYEPGATPWEVIMGAYRDLLQMRDELRCLEKLMGKTDTDLENVMKQYAKVSEEYERANGFACESNARRILTGLGFADSDFHREFAGFSGGQKTRIALARLLAEEPDILLLDEPTNHLDLVSIEWLEDFLISYPGSILVVSHDRRFLDRVVTRIVDLHQGQLYSYPGNYSRFAEQKQIRIEALEKAFQKQQEQILATEAFIRRYKAGVKARQARGRQAQLQRLERLEHPGQNAAIASWDLTVKSESGQDVLTIHNLSKNYPQRALFSGINLLLRKGERAALVGPNGCGKSTLLKIIMGELEADFGEYRLGSRVRLGYFAQEHESLDPELSILDDLVYDSDCTLEEARSLLGRMLFSGDDVFKQIKDLSGGERARLVLLKLLLSDANFLVLDEPTNHMDMESRMVVEDMLIRFDGTILMVSHDRCLIDRLADRLLVFEGNTLVSYTGNYSDYQELRKRKPEAESGREATAAVTEQQTYRARQKEIQRNLNRLLKQKGQAEETIIQLERRIAEIEESLADPERFTELDYITRLGEEYQELMEKYEEAFDNWEQLNQQWEEYQQEYEINPDSI